MTDDEAKPKYPGKLVLNANVRKKMHLVAEYYTFYGRKEGIYSDAYDDLVKRLAKRTHEDMQNVVIVEGETGSGKSSLALNLCLDLAKKLKVGFDLEHDYVYSSNDLWQKLARPDANPISLMDEGTVTLASNNAMRGSDKSIVSLFDTMRSKHWTTFICTPSHTRINSVVRRDHVEFKLRCTPQNRPLIKGYGRGFFECRRATHDEFGKGEPKWLMMYAGLFGDYPPLLRDEYLQIKEMRQNELMQTYVNKAKVDTAKDEREFKKYCPKDDPKGTW